MLKTSVLLAVLVFGVLGCDDSVNPYAPFQPRITVYALLKTNSTMQIVRVYSSYDPTVSREGEGAPDTSIADAVVTLSDQNTTYPLRDTVIYRMDTSQYAGDIAAKVAAPFAAAYGRTYSLVVQSQIAGSVIATTTVPPRSGVYADGIGFVSEPLFYDSRYFTLNGKVYGKGFLLRALLEYQVYINGIWFPKEDEVPRTFGLGADGTTVPIYAQLEPSPGGISLLWRLNTLAYTLGKVTTKYNAYHITFKRFIVEIRQYEENVFNYYQVVKRFQDSRTIRTDSPDFTNIRGGLGLFGAYTVDRIVYDLPLDYKGNR